MKLRKTAAGLLSAVMIAGGAFTIPAETNPFVIVSEAASKLDAPDNISATSDSSSVTIEWDEVEGADGYVLYRYSASKKTYIPVDSFEDTTCTVKNLKSGTTYRFKIAAYKLKKGKKAAQKQSEMIKIATDKAAEHSDLTGSAAPDYVKLRWTRVKGDALYRVYCMKDGESEFRLIGSAVKNDYTAKNLDSDTVYNFKVETLIKNGSKYKITGTSAVLTIKTKRPDDLKVADFAITDFDGNEYMLTEFTDKPVVIFFWIRANSDVDRYLGWLNSFYKKYGSDVNFLMINCEHKSLRNYVKDFAENQKLDTPIYYDWDITALGRQGTINTPYLMSINRKGELAKYYSGALNLEAIQKTIDLALE